MNKITKSNRSTPYEFHHRNNQFNIHLLERAFSGVLKIHFVSTAYRCIQLKIPGDCTYQNSKQGSSIILLLIEHKSSLQHHAMPSCAYRHISALNASMRGDMPFPKVVHFVDFIFFHHYTLLQWGRDKSQVCVETVV